MNQEARNKIQASEVQVEFDKHKMHWVIRRYYIPYKDTFEYIINVHNFDMHHLRERIDWELSAEELEDHFERDSTEISQYEIDKLVELVVLEFIEYAALALHLDQNHSFAMFEPIIPEGKAKEYWELKNAGLRTN